MCPRSIGTGFRDESITHPLLSKLFWVTECINLYFFISWHTTLWHNISGNMYVGFRIMQKDWSCLVVLVVGELDWGWIWFFHEHGALEHFFHAINFSVHASMCIVTVHQVAEVLHIGGAMYCIISLNYYYFMHHVAQRIDMSSLSFTSWCLSTGSSTPCNAQQPSKPHSVAYGAPIVCLQGLDNNIELQLMAAVQDPGVNTFQHHTRSQPCCTPSD